MWTHSMVPHYPSVTHQSPHRIPEKTTMEIGISVTNPYPILVQRTHPGTLTSFGDFHISSNELRLLIIKHVGHFIRRLTIPPSLLINGFDSNSPFHESRYSGHSIVWCLG